jgi:hypothetical protein
VLKDHRDPAAQVAQLAAGVVPRMLAVNDNFTAIGVFQAVEQAQQG